MANAETTALARAKAEANPAKVYGCVRRGFVDVGFESAESLESVTVARIFDTSPVICGILIFAHRDVAVGPRNHRRFVVVADVEGNIAVGEGLLVVFEAQVADRALGVDQSKQGGGFQGEVVDEFFR